MAVRDAAGIDQNFAAQAVLREGMAYYDAEDFDVYGVKRLDGVYRRMRYEDALAIGEKVAMISSECAGGRVRFATDSPTVAICVEYRSVSKVPNYSHTATMGFDLYAGSRYVGCFVPPMEAERTLEGVMEVAEKPSMTEYTLNFPICSEVSRLYIGVKEGCTIGKASGYSIKKPVVFYGSSITQGACASRPGNTYENRISRALDCDYLNLGFWGNARGEKELAEYVAGLEMSAFVYDYDYNTPSVEHLQATHERMFQIVRQRNPQLPIVIVSAPKYAWNSTFEQRLSIIRQTYQNAVAAGDRHVRFLSGNEMLKGIKDVAFADNVHPGDSGFLRMAKYIGEALKELMER